MNPLGKALDVIAEYPVPFAVSVAFILLTAFAMPAIRSARIRLLLLLSLGMILRLAVAVQDPVRLQSWPLNDDSHYYFNIAWNLTHGAGLRHDSFNTTTGFQPLFLLLMTPIYMLIDDKLLAVNVVMVMQAGIGLLLGIVLYHLARNVGGVAAGVLAAAVWATSPVFVTADLSGLETNLALLTTCLTVWYYLSRVAVPDGGDRKRYIVLGFLIGLGFLARIDSGLLGPLLVADILRREFRVRRFGRLTGDLAVMTLAASMPVLPWAAYNFYTIGSILPSSGQAVRFLSQAYGHHFLGGNTPSRGHFEIDRIPLEYYTSTILRGFSEIRRILSRVLPVWAGCLILAAAAYAGAGRLIRSIGRLGFFYGFLLLLFFSYTCYIFGQWFFDRYLIPFSIGYLLLLASAMRVVSAESVSGGRLARVRYAGVVLFPVVLGILLFNTLQSVERMLEKDTPSPYYRVAEWVNRNTPETAVIGAFQTGILGYYLERPFYGLDGKINQHALDAMKDRRIDLYVEDKKIDYLMDWPWVLADLFVRRSSDPDYLLGKPLVWRGPYDVFHLRGEGSDSVPPVPGPSAGEALPEISDPEPPSP